MTPLTIRLAELRESRGLTQEQLAELAGVRQATVSEIESGKRRASFDVLEKLCDALDVEPGEIIERVPAKKRR